MLAATPHTVHALRTQCSAQGPALSVQCPGSSHALSAQCISVHGLLASAQCTVHLVCYNDSAQCSIVRGVNNSIHGDAEEQSPCVSRRGGAHHCALDGLIDCSCVIMTLYDETKCSEPVDLCIGGGTEQHSFEPSAPLMWCVATSWWFTDELLPASGYAEP